jgi:hyperosmotically inducible protein
MKKIGIWGISVVALLFAGPVRTGAMVPQNTTTKSADEARDESIEHRLKADPSLKKYNIKVSVDSGVATLDGTVATQAQKARAARLATMNGITRVDNRIAVDASAGTKGTTGTIVEKTKDVGEKTKEGAEKVGEKTKDGAGKVVDKTKEGLSKTGEVITDGWITTRVHSRFVGEDLLKDSDINVDTNNHVVTLKGTVMSAAGRARAAAIAKDTEGVHRVVNQLTIGPKR